MLKCSLKWLTEKYNILVEVITSNVKFNQIIMILEFNPLLGYFTVISLFITKVKVVHSIH